jgi:hypothetical protein
MQKAQPLYCCRGMLFIVPLHSNGCDTNHIENTVLLLPACVLWVLTLQWPLFTESVLSSGSVLHNILKSILKNMLFQAELFHSLRWLPFTTIWDELWSPPHVLCAGYLALLLWDHSSQRIKLTTSITCTNAKVKNVKNCRWVLGHMVA